MSGPRFSITPAKAATDKNITDLDYRILGVYGSHTDKNGWCFRNQARIAEQLGVARQSVCRSTTRLVKFGYLERKDINEDKVKAGKSKKGLRSVNVYRVLMDSKEGPTPETLKALSPESDNAALSPQGDNGCHAGETTVVTAGRQLNDTILTTSSERHPLTPTGEAEAAIASPAVCEPASQENEREPAKGTEPKKKSTTKPKAETGAAAEDWAAFVKEYRAACEAAGRKGSPKGQAQGLKAWAKLTGKDRAERRAALKGYTADLKAEDWRKAQHISTFVNSGWVDFKPEEKAETTPADDAEKILRNQISVAEMAVSDGKIPTWAQGWYGWAGVSDAKAFLATVSVAA